MPTFIEIVPYVIFVVMDVMTHPEPTQVFVLSISLGVKKGFHPLIVKTARFQQIDYGKLVCRTSLCVRDSKVEPLSVFHCEVVPPEFQLVFVRSSEEKYDFNFRVRFKYNILCKI